MISLIANGPVYKGFAVSLCLTSDERVELTDWTNYESVAMVVGIATGDANDGILVNIQTDGIYENMGWSFTRCKPVYVFVSGVVTQDMPPRNVIKIGKAISKTKILINISEFVMVNV